MVTQDIATGFESFGGELAAASVRPLPQRPEDARLVLEPEAIPYLLSGSASDLAIAARQTELPRMWGPNPQTAASLADLAVTIMTRLDQLAGDKRVLDSNGPGGGSNTWILTLATAACNASAKCCKPG